MNPATSCDVNVGVKNDSIFENLNPRERRGAVHGARRRSHVVGQRDNPMHTSAGRQMSRKSSSRSQLSILSASIQQVPNLLTPRSKERGSVEAILFVACVGRSSDTPRSKERGSVEAV